MFGVMVLHVSELNSETQEKLDIGAYEVSPKVIALGRILTCLAGLTKREASWAIRMALKDVQNAGRRRRTKLNRKEVEN